METGKESSKIIDKCQIEIDRGIKWKFLKHKGPFLVPYQRLPDDIKFYYDEVHIRLSEEAEEVAVLYAKLLKQEIIQNSIFRENFFADWRKVMTEDEKIIITDLSKCNFEHLHCYIVDAVKNCNTTEYEKLKVKWENKDINNKHGFCKIDGQRYETDNFNVEPPSLIQELGPNLGKLKERVLSEYITINCSEDAKVPKPPKGHKWKEVIHNPMVTWLASWMDNVQNIVRYMDVHPSSPLKNEEYWKWSIHEKRNGKKWTNLKHNGPFLAPLYERLPIDVKFYYDGVHIHLSEETEEVAGFYAKVLTDDLTRKSTFKRNFFEDWRKVMSEEEKNIITDLKKCNFMPMHRFFMKERYKKDKYIENTYGFCEIDGQREKLEQFKVDPPGLSKAYTDCKKIGKLRRRILPEDITINCGKGASVPTPPKGHKWKNIIHNRQLNWFAYWKENVENRTKYMKLHPSSTFRAKEYFIKFETARQLNKYIDEIRAKYTIELGSNNMVICQRAVVLYFMDKLVLIAYDYKNEIGCLSFKISHIKLLKKKCGAENVVSIYLFGTNNLQYRTEMSVEKMVFKKLQLFTKNKKCSDLLFDQLTNSILNEYLEHMMEGLTDQIFKTYNASVLFEEKLDKIDKEKKYVSEKILSYNQAKEEIARLCNYEKKVVFSEKRKYCENVMPELEFYKLHCLDPRITVSWCKRNCISIDKVYNTRERDKSVWAMGMAGPHFRFSNPISKCIDSIMSAPEQEKTIVENGNNKSRNFKKKYRPYFNKKKKEYDVVTKWKFLEHKGPLFPPPYERLPKDVKFYYDGVHIRLSNEAEEVAGFFAKMMSQKLIKNIKFQENFFEDWREVMTDAEKEFITDLNKCTFEHMHNYFKSEFEKNRNMTEEEKRKIIKEKRDINKKYGFCNMDGQIEKILNFKIHQPGLFKVRKPYGKLGKLMKRVVPEDITINCSEDAVIPDPPEGHQWKKVIHNPNVPWLASWIENVSNQERYVRLHPNSIPQRKELWNRWKTEKDDDTKWKTLKHNGPVFAPPYERLPDDVKFYYDGMHIRLSEEAEEVAGYYARMLKHKLNRRKIFKLNFFNDWRDVMTEEEKKDKEKLKMEKKNIKRKHGFCYVDGKKEPIVNFRIEPPGLFKGRRVHQKIGKLRKRVVAEDITINCSEGAKVPDPPKGHQWKEVIHDPKVTWLASWRENVQGEVKYMSFYPSKEEWKKYETARVLHNHINEIRSKYTNDFNSNDMVICQRAIALYFIDKFNLGTTLRVDHIQLHDKKDEEEQAVIFNFFDKNFVHHFYEASVEKIVFEKLQLFIKNKQNHDSLFDRLNVSNFNEYLQEIMDGLTVTVFRTYNASIMFQKLLDDLTNANDSVDQKILSYNRGRQQVAKLYHHQRSVSKKKLKENNEQRVMLALASPKLDCLDPRITVAWCMTHKIPIPKIFRKKFFWAVGMADADFRF
ncbi:hypothetical protein FQR65_LT03904 [Abscondita terminalis]|nr:hypothetical protein FQR65_LT03904 [Abscondita terminalis]